MNKAKKILSVFLMVAMLFTVPVEASVLPYNSYTLVSGTMMCFSPYTVADSNMVSELYSIYMKMPGNIREALVKTGTYMYVTSNREGSLERSGIAAITHYPLTTMFIKGNDGYYRTGNGIPIYMDLLAGEGEFYETKNAVAHETGHAIVALYLLGYVQDNVSIDILGQDFRNIANREINNFRQLDGIAKVNSGIYEEVFAQAYAEYVLNPNKLYNNCPNIYSYVDMIVRNVR